MIRIERWNVTSQETLFALVKNYLKVNVKVLVYSLTSCNTRPKCWFIVLHHVTHVPHDFRSLPPGLYNGPDAL